MNSCSRGDVGSSSSSVIGTKASFCISWWYCGISRDRTRDRTQGVSIRESRQRHRTEDPDRRAVTHLGVPGVEGARSRSEVGAEEAESAREYAQGGAYPTLVAHHPQQASPKADGAHGAAGTHLAITSQSRRNHVAIKPQPRSNHIAITSQSHRNHIAITSQSNSNHKSNHIAITSQSRGRSAPAAS